MRSSPLKWLLVLGLCLSLGLGLAMWSTMSQASNSLVPLPSAPATIRVGFDANFPPYTYLSDEGVPIGYGVDLVRAIASEEGFQVQFVPASMEHLRRLLLEGQVDLLTMMAWTPERDQRFGFTDTHVLGYDSIFVSETNKAGIQAEADLGRARVLVVENDLAEERLLRLRTVANLIRVKTLAEGFRVLNDGGGDALVTPQIPGAATLKLLGYKTIRAATQPLMQTYFREYSMVTRKGDTELLAKLNHGLREIISNGDHATIYDRWLSTLDPGAKPRAERHRRLIIGWTITIALLLVSFCLLLAFRREVKRQTRKVAASERRFRGLVENLPGAVYRCARSPDWKIEFMSDQIERMTGYQATEFTSAPLLSFASLIHPDDAPLVWNRAADFLRDAVPYELDFRIVRRDGQIRSLHARGVSLRGPHNEVDFVDGILIDVTEQRRVSDLLTQQQSKMAQAARLSALGEMAGGIAHEINNPLAIINLRTHQLTQLADKGTVKPEDVRAIASGIESTAIRISKIIKSLQTVARESEQDPFEKVPVKTAISDAFELCLQRMRKHGIDVIVDDIPDTLVIECKRVQISQVLINLLNNAFDAVMRLSERYIRISVLDLGREIEIAITDSGRGIPRELSQKIFQPFFTTKGVGQGTGLGLSISKGLIEAHQGAIRLDAEYPTTRFVISLPKRRMASKSKASAGGPATRPQRPPGELSH